MAQPLVALQAMLPQLADPAELQTKAFQLRSLAAKAQAADQDRIDDQASRAAFAANPTDGTARLSALAAVSPAAYSTEAKRQADLAKSGAETQGAQLKNAHDSLDLAGRTFSYVRSNPTLENGNFALDFLGSKGVYSPEQVEQYKAMIAADPTKIAGLAEQAFRSALDAKSQLQKIDTRDTGGQVQTVGIDPVSGKATTLSTLAKTQSPDNIATNQRVAAEGAADRAARAAEGRANRASQAALARERQAAGGAEASLDNDTLDFLAERALRGDRTALQNLGRGAQGAANLVAVNQRVTQKAKDQGLTGADLASINADYSGQMAGLRTSGNISARVENAISEAKELAPLAIEAGRNVSRSGLLPFGKAGVMFDTQTNNPDLKKFATANNGLVAAYAGAMARGQKPTVSDYDHAREILATAQSQKAYEATVQQMFAEMGAASRAPQNVREHLRSQISGKGDHASPAASAGKVVDFGSLK